ncbi:SDR family oxidoreductase [Gordonia shandongensis]|uniref:SDR family oxidoreductase n=1 Tax=Gordonia shandongensis TaxID=376351 RepID=UPI0004231FF1|nr:SDR family oxidoreductase [Gordonia shandongensis]
MAQSTHPRRFAGQTAIVTGASRGIGYAVARRLVDEGAKVVITARKQEPLDDAVQRLGGHDVALAVAGRGDDPDHQSDAVARAIDTFGSADLLVNNTGINPVYGPLMQMDPDAARKIMDVNVISALRWTQAVHSAWQADHGGAIVNIASIAGLRPAPNIAFYGVSKAAVIHLTEELAWELGPGVRVNAVAPAVVKTRFATALYEGREEQVAEAYPLKRLGEPEDIGSVVAFLLSADSGWMTGQTVVVDGGVLLGGGV